MEPDKYYHSRLLLYLPWHTEEELLGDYVTYKDHYLECSDIIEHNAHAFHLHSDEMDAAIENIAENGPPEIAWDYIAPTIEENNIHAMKEDRVIVCNVDSDGDEDEVNDLDVPTGPSDTHDATSRKNQLSTLFEQEARKDIMTNSEYRTFLHCLNTQQHQIVMANCLWCKMYVQKNEKR